MDSSIQNCFNYTVGGKIWHQAQKQISKIKPQILLSNCPFPYQLKMLTIPANKIPTQENTHIVYKIDKHHVVTKQKQVIYISYFWKFYINKHIIYLVIATAL